MAVIQGGGISYDRGAQVQNSLANVATSIAQSKITQLEKQKQSLVNAEKSLNILGSMISTSGMSPESFIAQGLGSELLDATMRSLSDATGGSLSQQEAATFVDKLIDYYNKNPSDTQIADRMKYQWGGSPSGEQAPAPVQQAPAQAPSASTPQQQGGGTGAGTTQGGYGTQGTGGLMYNVKPSTAPQAQAPTQGQGGTAAAKQMPTVTPILQSVLGNVFGQNVQQAQVPAAQAPQGNSPAATAPSPATGTSQVGTAQPSNQPPAYSGPAPQASLQNQFAGLAKQPSVQQAQRPVMATPPARSTENMFSNDQYPGQVAPSAQVQPPRQGTVPQTAAPTTAGAVPATAQRAGGRAVEGAGAVAQDNAPQAAGRQKPIDVETLSNSVGKALYNPTGKTDKATEGKITSYWNKVQQIGGEMSLGSSGGSLADYLTGGSSPEVQQYFDQFSPEELEGGLAAFVGMGKLQLSPSGYSLESDDAQGNAIYKNAEGKVWSPGMPWPEEKPAGVSMLDLTDYKAFEQQMSKRGLKVAEAGTSTGGVKRNQLGFTAEGWTNVEKKFPQIVKTFDAVDVADGTAQPSTSMSKAAATNINNRVATAKTVDEAFGFTPSKVDMSYLGPKDNTQWTEKQVPKVTEALQKVSQMFENPTKSFREKSEARRAASIAGGWVNTVWNQMSDQQRKSMITSMKTQINTMTPSEAYFQFGNDFASVRHNQLLQETELAKAMATTALANSNVQAAQAEALTKQISDTMTAVGKILDSVASVAIAKKQGLSDLFKTDAVSESMYNNAMSWMKTFTKAAGFDFTATTFATVPGGFLGLGKQVVPESDLYVGGQAPAQQGMSAQAEAVKQKYGIK